jgi:hypothetical protein
MAIVWPLKGLIQKGEHINVGIGSPWSNAYKQNLNFFFFQFF